MGKNVIEWAESESSRHLVPLGDRWRHVRGVALTVANLVPNDEDCIAAAWLHDVGYGLETTRTGMHALDGAEFLERIGAPDAIVSLVAYHTGAEFEAEERDLVDHLSRFGRPEQEDLDVLILADLCTGPTGARVDVASRLAEIVQRYDANHPVHRAVMRARPYLEMCASRAASRVGYPM